MARSASQFLTYVKLDFKRDDKDTEILSAYNDTIRHLGSLEALEAVKLTSWIPTEIGQYDYPLPSTLCHLLHPVKFIESFTEESGYALNKMSKTEFDINYPNPLATDVSKSRPKDYCVHGNSIQVGDPPDKATYILEINWARFTTDQVADADVHEFGSNWEEVLKWGTLARLYEGMGQTAESDRYWALYTSDKLGYPIFLALDTSKHERMGLVENNDL